MCNHGYKSVSATLMEAAARGRAGWLQAGRPCQPGQPGRPPGPAGAPGPARLPVFAVGPGRLGRLGRSPLPACPPVVRSGLCLFSSCTYFCCHASLPLMWHACLFATPQLVSTCCAVTCMYICYAATCKYVLRSLSIQVTC